jgi:hypothetical protein
VIDETVGDETVVVDILFTLIPAGFTVEVIVVIMV